MAIDHLHHGLSQLNDDLYRLRGANYELLLAQLLEAQSTAELAISKVYTTAFAWAVALLTVMGYFVIGWQNARLTVAMWDRLRNVEEQLLSMKQTAPSETTPTDG